MQTLIHADIFFFISSIGFMIVFILVIVAGISLIGILQSVKRISAKLEGDVDSISTDAKEFFSDVRGSTIYRMLFGKPRKK